MKMSLKASMRKKLKFSVLVGTEIKALKQAAEMKHDLSACIVSLLLLTIACLAKLEIKMHALRLCFISAEWFSGFIAILTNTENFKFFLMLDYVLFLVIQF